MKCTYFALAWSLSSASMCLAPELAGQEPTLARSNSMATDPGRREMDVRMAAIAKRGPYDLALVDKPLPGGLRAVIRLNQPGDPDRYVITAAADLNDPLIFEARLTGVAYEARNPEDDSPVEIRLYHGGRVETESRKKGLNSSIERTNGHHSDPERHARVIKSKMAAGKTVQIHGYGTATLVAFE
jgi:hypothetical protein